MTKQPLPQSISMPVLAFSPAGPELLSRDHQIISLLNPGYAGGAVRIPVSIFLLLATNCKTWVDFRAACEAESDNFTNRELDRGINEALAASELEILTKPQTRTATA